MPIRATVWGENIHEQKSQAVADNYPQGMHGQIAKLLGEDANIIATTATLQQPEHGLTVEKLAKPTCCSGGGMPAIIWSRTPSSRALLPASGKAWA